MIKMELDDTTMICKICFEGQTSKSRLISACKCKGTGKWVHESCLKSWLLQQPSETIHKCEVCLFKYKTDQSSSLLLKFKSNPRLLKVILILLPLLGLSLYTFFLVCERDYKVLQKNLALYICVFILVSIFVLCVFSIIADSLYQILQSKIREFTIFPISEDFSNLSSTTVQT
jgi:E3 ubiquitin-protein ligase DOA10